MVTQPNGSQRRTESLSRDRIVEASIAILDRDGESGLTFRALSERLATGAGAIYWHIANKSDLLTAACDAVIARTITASVGSATPAVVIRTLALDIFDAIDAHPWVGSALTAARAQLPMVRIVERLAEQVAALDVPGDRHWAAVSALFSYILGVGGQNAANRQFAQVGDLDRADFLDAVAGQWSQLDPAQYPFVRSLADQLRAHDDRADFLAGIGFILKGIASTCRK